MEYEQQIHTQFEERFMAYEHSACAVTDAGRVIAGFVSLLFSKLNRMALEAGRLHWTATPWFEGGLDRRALSGAQIGQDCCGGTTGHRCRGSH